MLVLTRKPGQSIMIGDGIEVQVLSVAGEKVRIGIAAPRDVGIYRDEVYERIEQNGAVETAEDEPDRRAATRFGASPSTRRASRTSRTRP